MKTRRSSTLTAAAALLAAVAFGAGHSLLARSETQAVPNPASIGAIGEMGYLIKQVQPKSPAALAGLKVGDLIVALNDEQTNSIDDVWRVVRGSLEKPLKVKYLRHNSATGGLEEQTVTVTPVPWGSWNRAAK